MLFSYNVLQEFIQGKLPSPKKLEELLTLHVFEVEGIEDKGNDSLIDISVLPQRSDCLSHFGMAREISVLLRKPFVSLREISRREKRKPLKAEMGSIKPVKVTILPKNLVPRYTALCIQGVTIGASPQWLQGRLALLGIHPINNVVDITNYTMAVLGQPLHAFDYDKIRGSTLTLRLSKRGETIELLDDTELQLPKGILVAQDAATLVDLVGIKGGNATAISAKTKNILLQAATFDAPYMYTAKKMLDYTTDAANLYSHGLDPELTKPALEFACSLLSKFGGGTIVQVVDMYPKKPSKRMLKLSHSTIEQILGMSLLPRLVADILKRLGFGIKPMKHGFQITVPSFRQDVSIPQDIVEEIGRIYGYQNIKAAPPEASVLAPRRNENLFWQDTLRDALKGAGFTELYTYSFTGKQENLVEIENPVSQDFQYLRGNLVCNLLKSVALNMKVTEDKEIKIFEIGKAFSAPKQERLMIGVVGTETFYALKGMCDLLFSAMGIADVWYDNFQPSPNKGKVSLWHREKSAEVKVQNKEVGFLGEVSPETLSKFKVTIPVCVMELDLYTLIELSREEREYAPIPRFPSVRRDIALFVPEETKVDEVMNTMEIAGGALVWDIDLFDIYEGEGVPDGKKNLAFHIEYRAEDRTLKGEEVEKVHRGIIKALKENPEWEVRD